MLSESNGIAISLRDVSKLFFKQEQHTFKEFIPALLTGKRTGEWFWALKDINLEIKKGEIIGIIGPNGSGKSTFLKLIAGVSAPTEGKLTVRGKVAPLIELGAGFHPELTGKENVYLNGVILGMKRKEVDDQFKSIVDFADLWDFIDQPIKHYSSGMYLRLAFAIAVHTKPDILLLDEIIAVGDEQFQKKCFAKLEEYKRKEKTIVFVSHDLRTVETFCSRVAFIQKGRLVCVGPASEIVRRYRKDLGF